MLLVYIELVEEESMSAAEILNEQALFEGRQEWVPYGLLCISQFLLQFGNQCKSHRNPLAFQCSLLVN